jgi:ribosomal protein S18 acetylase RimI-like enzyme
VVHELAGRGCEVVNLTVRATNLGARRLYERLGFTEERLVRPYRRGFHLP